MDVTAPTARNETFLRLPVVSARVGLKKSAIYAGVSDGTFPASVKIGRRAVAWQSSAIDAWMQATVLRSMDRDCAAQPGVRL